MDKPTKEISKPIEKKCKTCLGYGLEDTPAESIISKAQHERFVAEAIAPPWKACPVCGATIHGKNNA